MEVKITKERINMNKPIIGGIGFIPVIGSKIITAFVSSGRKYKIIEDDKVKYLTRTKVVYEHEVKKVTKEEIYKCCIFFKSKRKRSSFPINDAVEIYRQAGIETIVKFKDLKPYIEYRQSFFAYIDEDNITLLTPSQHATERKAILKQLKKQNEN